MTRTIQEVRRVRVLVLLRLLMNRFATIGTPSLTSNPSMMENMMQEYRKIHTIWDSEMRGDDTYCFPKWRFYRMAGCSLLGSTPYQFFSAVRSSVQFVNVYLALDLIHLRSTILRKNRVVLWQSKRWQSSVQGVIQKNHSTRERQPLSEKEKSLSTI